MSFASAERRGVRHLSKVIVLLLTQTTLLMFFVRPEWAATISSSHTCPTLTAFYTVSVGQNETPVYSVYVSQPTARRKGKPFLPIDLNQTTAGVGWTFRQFVQIPGGGNEKFVCWET